MCGLHFLQFIPHGGFALAEGLVAVFILLDERKNPFPILERGKGQGLERQQREQPVVVFRGSTNQKIR